MLLPRATATPRRRVFGTSHRPQPLRLKITPLEARNTLYNPCHLQLQGPKSTPQESPQSPLSTLPFAAETPIRVSGDDPFLQLASVGHDLALLLGALGHVPDLPSALLSSPIYPLVIQIAAGQ